MSAELSGVSAAVGADVRVAEDEVLEPVTTTLEVIATESVGTDGGVEGALSMMVVGATVLTNEGGSLAGLAGGDCKLEIDGIITESVGVAVAMEVEELAVLAGSIGIAVFAEAATVACTGVDAGATVTKRVVKRVTVVMPSSSGGMDTDVADADVVSSNDDELAVGVISAEEDDVELLIDSRKKCMLGRVKPTTDAVGERAAT